MENTFPRRLATFVLCLLFLTGFTAAALFVAPITTPVETGVSTAQIKLQGEQEKLIFIPIHQPEEALALTAKKAFVYDVTTGRLIFLSGEADTRVYPASITKLFTAYVALQYVDTNTVITAGDALNLVGKDSSIADIRWGNKLTVQMLIEGMLLPSGNDAACVLGVYIGRSIGGAKLTPTKALQVFVDEMNRQAKELGLIGTHFTNTDGYHHKDHYSTLGDIAKIGKLALENPVIREAAGQDTKTVTYVSGQKRTWESTNFLLNPKSKYYISNATGLKTGTTDAAGNCLLSSFDVNGRDVIVGVFGSTTKESRFADTLKVVQACIAQ